MKRELRTFAMSVLVLVMGCATERARAPAQPPSAQLSSDAGSAADSSDSSPAAPREASVPERERACTVKDSARWHIRLDVRAPKPAHKKALIARRRQIPGTLLCGPSDLYLELTTPQVRGLLGSHASFNAVENAGNATGACGFFAEVQPSDFVPEALAADVRAITFNTDAKFDLVADVHPCSR